MSSRAHPHPMGHLLAAQHPVLPFRNMCLCWAAPSGVISLVIGELMPIPFRLGGLASVTWEPHANIHLSQGEIVDPAAVFKRLVRSNPKLRAVFEKNHLLKQLLERPQEGLCHVTPHHQMLVSVFPPTPVALDKKPVSGGGGYPQFLILTGKNKEGFGCQGTLNFLFSNSLFSSFSACGF